MNSFFVFFVMIILSSNVLFAKKWDDGVIYKSHWDRIDTYSSSTATPVLNSQEDQNPLSDLDGMSWDSFDSGDQVPKKPLKSHQVPSNYRWLSQLKSGYRYDQNDADKRRMVSSSTNKLKKRHLHFFEKIFHKLFFYKRRSRKGIKKPLFSKKKEWKSRSLTGQSFASKLRKKRLFDRKESQISSGENSRSPINSEKDSQLWSHVFSDN